MQRRPISLSDEQQDVVDHALGVPATVDAGAGTGKTHTIVARVIALHNSGACRASKILLLTFARKAAAELRARVLRELGPGEEPPHCATFHSFAHDVLLDHAYDIGLSPDTVVLEDADSRVIFRAAFEDLVHGRLEADPGGFPLRRQDDLCDALFDISVRLKQAACSPDDFERRALAAGQLIAALPYRRLQSKYKKRTKGQDVKIEGEVDDAQFERESREYVSRVGAAAALFRRFDALLLDRQALTYADLLYRADLEVRRSPALRDELRRSFLHCIVDEYQDTDVAQHRFLQAIFGESLDFVVAVGDVRQSIYAFRGAHPENMEAFAALPGCVPFRLTQSRRSRQEILDFAHHVIAGDRDDPEPLAAHRGAAGAPVVHVASLWSDDGIPRNAAEQRVEEAAWLAARIAMRLASGDLHPRDIAVLMRNKTNSQIYTDALLRAGIPFQLAGGVGFYDAPEVLDALAWLRLLADPLDSHAATRVVQSPGFGLNDADVVALALGLDRREPTAFARRVFVEQTAGGLSPDGVERVERLRETLDALEPFAAQSLPAALPAVLDRSGLRLHHERSTELRAPQALANLRKLERLAVAFSQRVRGATARDFVNYLDELERALGDEREADASEIDAVTISTIHAAKGLEWPVVFVADVWPVVTYADVLRLDSDGALLCSEGGDGRVPFHVLARRLGADTSGWVPHKDDRNATAARDREDRRLFYVGLTRARDELFVSGKRAKPGKDGGDGKPHRFLEETYEWLAQMGWPTDEPVTPSIADQSRGSEAGPPPIQERASTGRDYLAWIRGTERREADTSSLPLSFSIIRRYEQCPRAVAYAAKLGIPPMAADRAQVDVADSREDPVRDSDSLLGLGAFGNLVHRALELWAAGRIDFGADPHRRPKPSSPPLAADEAISQAASDLGETPSKSDVGRAAEAFSLMTAALAGWTPLFAEAPFTIDFDGITVSGFIDLIARDPAGAAVVVDYKTGTAPAADYALQLALYREAARGAYGLDAGAVIARIRDGVVTFEPVPDLDRAAVTARVRTAAVGIANADDSPQPGVWCATCPYRAAPCMSFVS
jgi:DNA helicase-2/ATP-dependent DNA helicase PcrA